MTQLRLSMEQFGRVLRAAYVEGYVQGSEHPSSQSVIPKGRELAELYWLCVEERVNERRERPAVSPEAPHA